MNTLDDMLRKVSAMMARADHPNTPVPEAETARNMAEALMTKYRIDEAMMQAAGQDTQGIVPVWRKFVITTTDSEFAAKYRTIASACVHHFDCEAVFRQGPMRDVDPTAANPETWVSYIEAVGYDSDLRMAEAMFASCQVAFQSRLEPRYDPTLSEQVNAYLMRSAGMEGWRIAQAIYGKDDKALRPKVRGMFKNEAIARGEDPSILMGKGNSVKTFRTSFADGFAMEIYSRLQTMRLSRGNEGGIVLAGRATAVREAFYVKFPQYRPTTGPAPFSKAANDGCPKCKAAKSGYCREHGWMRPRQAAPQAFNGAAYTRGKAAARAADIGASPRGTKVQGNDKAKEIN